MKGARAMGSSVLAGQRLPAQRTRPDSTMRRYISWFTNLYPLWTIAVSLLALAKPGTLVWFNPYVVTALGFVMLNMGLTLSTRDFKSLGKMPGSVAVGFVLHYTIMPLSGWLVAHWLKLDPQFAVGLILVASCPC